MTVEELSKQMLTLGAQRLVEAAMQKQADGNHDCLGVNHWLVALLERHPTMVEAMVAEFRVETVRTQAVEWLLNGEVGRSLPAEEAIRAAYQRAQQRQRQQASERDLAALILEAAGFLRPVNGESISTQGSPPGKTDSGVSGQPVIPVRVQVPTPALDQFGRDLTREYREGRLAPVVGREAEIALVIETLCRRTKRNPILVGPAGVGKTAIVEGLARQVSENKVPALLSGSRIIVLQPSVLVAGAHISGELEKRMRNVLQEASQDGIILFIDEIHTVMGAGGMLGTTDLGSMLKPALARGDIACIAATTDDEFRRYIENDAALERRFQPIRVNELSDEQTLTVLRAIREEMVKRTPVTVGDEVLVWLVDFGRQYMRNRYFPDKAVDLLEQCFAHALAVGKSGVELADAQEVAQKIVGMPVVTTERLELLKTELMNRRLLTAQECSILLNRLQVTLRGLDMRASRPNAIILLTGEAIESSLALSESIAEALFGSSDRVISIDMSRFGSPEDINLLVGAPPGYVGYNDRLPLHELAQIPWCVLRLDRIDACHPRIREVIAQACRDGWIMDGRGKTLYLSDAVIVMTAEISVSAQRGMGFKPEAQQVGGEEVYSAVAGRIGESLAERVDLFSFGSASSEGVSVDWIEKHFLGELSNRYLKQGIKLNWERSFIAWVEQQQARSYSEHDWENWVDSFLTPNLIPYLPASGWKNAVEVTVGFNGSDITVNRQVGKEG